MLGRLSRNLFSLFNNRGVVVCWSKIPRFHGGIFLSLYQSDCHKYLETNDLSGSKANHKCMPIANSFNR
jgi:hypothetical protein